MSITLVMKQSALSKYFSETNKKLVTQLSRNISSKTFFYYVMIQEIKIYIISFYRKVYFIEDINSSNWNYEKLANLFLLIYYSFT
jgi:hypothetical protein